MKQKLLQKVMLLLFALIAGSTSAWAGDETLTIDFEESSTSSYSDWTFSNIVSHATNSGVTAHGGSYFGRTNGTATAYIATESKIAIPKSITFYVSKQTTNTTASTWTVEVSTDGSTWTQVGDAQDAKSMDKGTWVEVTRSLESYTNVFVRVYYSGSTAVRCIDDITLTYTPGKSTKPTVTFDFADTAWGFPADYTKTEGSYTNDGYTFVVGETAADGHKALMNNSEQVGLIFGKNGAKITFPTFNFNVSNIKVYGRSGAAVGVKFNIFVEDVAVSDEATGSNTDHEFSIAAGYQAAGTTYVLKLTTTDKNAQISKIEIFGYVPVTITSATWASFSSASALDFTGTGVTAYIAKEKDASNVTLTEITKVPANTGIVVNAAAETYNIPVLTVAADATTGNLLKPWLTAGTPGDETYYTLAVSGTDPIFKKSSGGTLAAGKSYLVLPGSGARELGVDFGNETAINALENSNKVNDGAIYDLSGRRVENPTKGIYIMNGKKFVVK